MRKTLIATAVIGALSIPTVVLADDAPAASPVSFNVGVVTDYLFRGISQTHTNPAIQGGVDYANPNGLYVGAWASSISWVNDGYGGSTPTEIDVYGGYSGTFAGDWGYDVGLITYNYPGNGRTGDYASPNTQEVYGSLSYKWISVKYSHVVSSHFVGFGTSSDAKGNTRGSHYLEVNASYDFGNGWGISGHAGHQTVKDNAPVSYSDWNVGVTKDVGFGVVGLTYSDTNTSGSCNSTGGTNAYCWTTWQSNTNYKDVSRGTAVLSFTKSF
jgi:uncharacterized protein (TIGR02001 family)